MNKNEDYSSLNKNRHTGSSSCTLALLLLCNEIRKRIFQGYYRQYTHVMFNVSLNYDTSKYALMFDILR